MKPYNTQSILQISGKSLINKVKKERYLIKQDNTIHTFSIKLNKFQVQNKSKVHKQ